MTEFKAGRKYKHMNMVNVYIYVVEMLEHDMEIVWSMGNGTALFDDRVPIPTNQREWYEIP